MSIVAHRRPASRISLQNFGMSLCFLNSFINVFAFNARRICTGPRGKMTVTPVWMSSSSCRVITQFERLCSFRKFSNFRGIRKPPKSSIKFLGQVYIERNYIYEFVHAASISLSRSHIHSSHSFHMADDRDDDKVRDLRRLAKRYGITIQSSPNAQQWPAAHQRLF